MRRLSFPILRSLFALSDLCGASHAALRIDVGALLWRAARCRRVLRRDVTEYARLCPVIASCRRRALCRQTVSGHRALRCQIVSRRLQVRRLLTESHRQQRRQAMDRSCFMRSVVWRARQVARDRVARQQLALPPVARTLCPLEMQPSLYAAQPMPMSDNSVLVHAPRG